MGEPLYARLYRRAMCLAPLEFRARYEDEMTSSLVAMITSERARLGRIGAAWLWGRAMIDAYRTVSRERRRDRPASRTRPWTGLGGDVRYVLRSWRHVKTFAAAACLTIALGLGLAAAVFSLADGILFRALPFAGASRLYVVRSTGTGPGSLPLAGDMYEVRARHSGIEGAFAYGTSDTGGSLKVGDRWVSPLTYEASEGFVDLLGLRLPRGRGFSGADHLPNAPIVALASDGFWRRELHADPEVVGRRLQLRGYGDVTVEIIGVLPASFRSLEIVNSAPDLILPQRTGAWLALPRGGQPVRTYATVKLQAGVSVAQAEAEMNGIVSSIQHAEGVGAKPRTMQLVPLRDTLFRAAQPTVRLVFMASLAVLALVMTNLTHLLLARSTARAAELATRAALGAGIWRIGRLVLVESALLAIAGTVLGLAVGAGLSRLLEGQLPEMRHVYRVAAIEFGGRVVWFTGALAVLVCTAAAIVPAWRLGRLHGHALDELRTRAASASRLRASRSLLVVETAIAFVVVASGALVALHLRQLLTTPLGFSPDGAFMVSIGDAPDRTARPPADWVAVSARIAADLGSDPAVEAVGVIDGHPTHTLESGVEFPKTEKSVSVKFVSGRFFDALAMPIVQGRTFTDAESFGNGDVAIVDADAAAVLWPGQWPLGQTLRDSRGKDRTVIGVTTPIRTSLTVPDARLRAYVPLRVPRSSLSLVVRSRTLDDAAIAALVARVTHSEEPDLWIRVSSMAPAKIFSRETGEPILRTTVMTVFAVVALLLIAAALYGLVTYAVAQRLREFGVRLALGAQPRRLGVLVVRHALVPVLLGLALGIGATYLTTPVLAAAVSGMGPADPRVLAAVAALMLACATVAAARPARRASRVDPVEVLRAE